MRVIFIADQSRAPLSCGKPAYTVSSHGCCGAEVADKK